MNDLKKVLGLMVFVLLCCKMPAQMNVDSLWREYGKAKHDTLRCRLLVLAGENVYLEYPDSAVTAWDKCRQLAKSNLGLSDEEGLKKRFSYYYATALSNLASVYVDRGEAKLSEKYNKEALFVYEKLNDNSGIATVLNNLGYFYSLSGEVDKGIEYYKKALQLQEKLKDQFAIATALYNLGAVYNYRGDVVGALEHFHRSLKIMESIHNTSGIAMAMNDIAGVFMKQGDPAKALEYLMKIKQLYEKAGDKQGIAETLNNLGIYYGRIGEQQKSLDYLQRSLAVRIETKDARGIAVSYNNLAMLMEDMKKPDEALKYYQEGIKIQEELNDQVGTVNSLNNVSQFLMANDRYAEAEEWAEKGLRAARELGFPDNIKVAAGVLKIIYKKQGKFKEADEMFSLYLQMRDSICNEAIRKATFKKQFQIEYETQAIKDSIEGAARIKEEKLIHEQEISQQRTYTYGGFAGLGLTLILAGVSLRAYKNKQKANSIIIKQKQLVDDQRHIIEEKQKEIIDSINYARRIQRTQLTNEKYILRKLNELNKNNYN